MIRHIFQTIAVGGLLFFLSLFAFSWVFPEPQDLPVAPIDNPKPKPSPQPIPTPEPPVNPEPKPRPKPTDDYASAYHRAKREGTPLVVLIKADGCPPCNLVTTKCLSALKAHGELGIVDSDREPTLAQELAPNSFIPRLLVYQTVSGPITTDLVGSDQIWAYCFPGKAQESSGPVSCPPRQTKIVSSEAPTKPKDTRLSLVMVKSSSAAADCQAMEAILNRIQEPWLIAYIDGDDPRASQWVELYGIQQYPYLITYRGHEALEVGSGVIPEQDVKDWLERLQAGGTIITNSRFKRCTAQDSLKALDREYLQMRLTPGSCGMLGCLAHGGGWVTENVRAQAGVAKPRGHWEQRKVCGPAGCQIQQVWVADPDPTGTVPWN